ncbi:MAG: hypothetical protein EA427_04535 [Spirochaetaceae bacterium]|nr:MAG: hypothetical protein EA427_04535 [Spirochaetaceae bacterium]
MEAFFPGEFVFSPYSATTVRPQPAYEFFNPAFAYLREEDPFDFGPRIPLGIAAIFLFPERNPLLYFTDRDLFDTRFDLLSFYDQLRYPASVLINPGRSPQEVIVGIEQETIRVTTGDGRPLLFDDVSGASGISRPFSPLVPAPLVSYHHRRKDIYSVTGVFLASTGHSLKPGDNLRGVLEGDPVEPDTRYEVTASASAAGGVSQSLSYGITAYGENATVTVAPRVVGYYRFFTAQARIQAGAETDQENLPAGTDSRQSLFLSHPGNGWGSGARLDLGTALARDRFRAGVSILNILGVDTVTGTITDGNVEDEPTRITTVGPAPAATLSASYQVPLKTGALEFAVDTLLSESISAHGGVLLVRRAFMFGLSGGYKGGYEGTVTAGVRRGRRRAALSLNVHQSPFVQDVVWGIGLHVRVRR